MDTSDVKMRHDYGKIGAKVQDPENPEAVIAYPEMFVRQMLADSKLTLQEPIHFGFWCGRQGSVTFQDLVVCRKWGSKPNLRKFWNMFKLKSL